MTEHEHRRRTDHNGNFIHERATDTDTWARLAGTVERYKVLWVVAMLAAAWIGSRIIQPLNAVSVLAAQQTAVVQRLDKADADRNRMENILTILVRMQCLQLDNIDRAKLGLDCRDIPVTLTPRGY